VREGERRHDEDRDRFDDQEDPGDPGVRPRGEQAHHGRAGRRGVDAGDRGEVVPVSNSGGTRTNSEDAGVTELSMSSVPPPTPMERVRVRRGGGRRGTGVRGMAFPPAGARVRRREQQVIRRSQRHPDD
jgi:hypothetical protein